VTIFDAGSMTVRAPSAALGEQEFNGIAIAPDGSRVYFGTLNTGNDARAMIRRRAQRLSGGTPCP
jgi:hypothetical protein